jgi:serine/threonine-protein kinase RsbW
MQNFVIDQRIASDLKNVTPFIESVSDKILGLGGDAKDAFNIKLVLEEALTNGMRHGNKLDSQLFVSVHVVIGRSKVVIDVHDEGAGFDPDRLPDPTSNEHIDQPGGRGVFLMRRIMDSVEYYDQGRGVRMSKELKQ